MQKISPQKTSISFLYLIGQSQDFQCAENELFIKDKCIVFNDYETYMFCCSCESIVIMKPFLK